MSVFDSYPGKPVGTIAMGTLTSMSATDGEEVKVKVSLSGGYRSLPKEKRLEAEKVVKEVPGFGCTLLGVPGLEEIEDKMNLWLVGETFFFGCGVIGCDFSKVFLVTPAPGPDCELDEEAALLLITLRRREKERVGEEKAKAAAKNEGKILKKKEPKKNASLKTQKKKEEESSGQSGDVEEMCSQGNAYFKAGDFPR